MDKKRKFCQQGILLTIGIILMGACLRAPITAVGTLVSTIQSDLSISGSAAGMITTIPLIAFAVVSPFVSRFSKKTGYGTAIVIGLALLIVGAVIRSYTNTTGIFIGTAFMGVGISIGNVLVPSVIKLKYPHKVGLYTGIYAASMAVFSGIAAAVSVPFSENGLGWKNTLALWIGVLAIAVIVWIVLKNQINQDGNVAVTVEKQENHGKSIYRSGMAWWVTLLVGLQSLLYYCFVAWLPTMLLDKGFDTATAGYFATFNQLIGLPMSFFIPIIAAKMKNQKGLAALTGGVYFAGMFFLWINHSTAGITLALCMTGLAAGSAMSLATCIVALRAANAAEAAELAGMSQFIGYILAAIGPTLLGKVYDMTRTWSVAIIFMLVCLGGLTICGIKAGSERPLFTK